ncbi:MAG: hypothetical protein CTY34_01995 [Methylobacter sp.]|nr:MAG: hypothetical protein CTY34_01995 [Methylobacter sp.]
MSVMSPEELRKVAGKIAKCMALAASDNPGEAEAAKRQAQALLKKHNLTVGDVSAADVREARTKTGLNYRPPVYLSYLARVISDAFGCGGVVNVGYSAQASITFFGLGAKPELAAYTFDVLRRQIVKDRAAFVATIKRYKRANKTRKANLFCEAWVCRVGQQVSEFAGNEREKVAVEAYRQKRYGAKSKAETRTQTTALPNDWQASAAGYSAAERVSLHTPVPTERVAMLVCDNNG